MAKATQRAQEQLGNTKCDICDTYKDVIWRCLNCQETLCNQCKTYHLRSKATRNHTVTGLANTTEENPGTSIFCPDHEDEAFLKYCTTCNTLVCLECIIGTHKNHEYIQIGDIIKQNRAQLEETFDQIKTKMIPELEQSILSITQMQENYSQEILKLTEVITTKGEELKEVIDSLISILKQEVIQQATKDEKCLKETKEQIDQKLTTLKTQLSKQEERVKRFGDFDIIVKTDDIKSSLSEITKNSTNLPSVQPPIFQTGQNNEKELKKMIGGLALDMKQYLQDHTHKDIAESVKEWEYEPEKAIAEVAIEWNYEPEEAIAETAIEWKYEPKEALAETAIEWIYEPEENIAEPAKEWENEPEENIAEPAKEWKYEQKEDIAEPAKEWKYKQKEARAEPAKEWKYKQKEAIVEPAKEWKYKQNEAIVEPAKEWKYKQKEAIVEPAKEWKYKQTEAIAKKKIKGHKH